MPELLIDFITSLDGYGAAEGWPGWWGLEESEYLAWLAEAPEADYTVLMGATTYRVMSGFAAAGEPGTDARVHRGSDDSWRAGANWFITVSWTGRRVVGCCSPARASGLLRAGRGLRPREWLGQRIRDDDLRHELSSRPDVRPRRRAGAGTRYRRDSGPSDRGPEGLPVP
jgi:hypothetical protein